MSAGRAFVPPDCCCTFCRSCYCTTQQAHQQHTRRAAFFLPFPLSAPHLLYCASQRFADFENCIFEFHRDSVNQCATNQIVADLQREELWPLPASHLFDHQAQHERRQRAPALEVQLVEEVLHRQSCRVGTKTEISSECVHSGCHSGSLPKRSLPDASSCACSRVAYQPAAQQTCFPRPVYDAVAS